MGYRIIRDWLDVFFCMEPQLLPTVLLELEATVGGWPLS